MNLLFLLLVPIWVLSFPSFSASDPVLPSEKDPFFKNSSDLVAHSPEVAEVKPVHHQDLNKKIFFSLVVSSSLLGVILLFLSCFWIFRLKKKSNSKHHQNSDAANGVSLDKFPSMKIGGKKGYITAIDYQLLVTATNNFDDANILGEGGLGRVYKAHFNDHFHAAVKKIYGGGLEAEREFEVISEIMLLIVPLIEQVSMIGL